MPDMLPMSAAQKSYPVAVFVDFEFGYQATHLTKSRNSSELIELCDLLDRWLKPMESKAMSLSFVALMGVSFLENREYQPSSTCTDRG
jgi:hypothetical protein